MPRYVAFVDMAGGARSGDSAALAIAHAEGSRAVLDCIRHVAPPFSPGAVITSVFVPVLQAYGIREVRGDRYAVGFVKEFFDGAGITFVPSALTKSQLYAELLALVNTGVVELLDDPTLKNQLLALQRRARRGGQDEIDHPRGGHHDDVANVAAGALVHVAGIGITSKGSVLLPTNVARRGVDPVTAAQHAAEQRKFLARVALRTLTHCQGQDQRARRDLERDTERFGPGTVVFRTYTSSRS